MSDDEIKPLLFDFEKPKDEAVPSLNGKMFLQDLENWQSRQVAAAQDDTQSEPTADTKAVEPVAKRELDEPVPHPRLMHDGVIRVLNTWVDTYVQLMDHVENPAQDLDRIVKVMNQATLALINQIPKSPYGLLRETVRSILVTVRDCTISTFRTYHRAEGVAVLDLTQECFDVTNRTVNALAMVCSAITQLQEVFMDDGAVPRIDDFKTMSSLVKNQLIVDTSDHKKGCSQIFMHLIIMMLDCVERGDMRNLFEISEQFHAMAITADVFVQPYFNEPIGNKQEEEE